MRLRLIFCIVIITAFRTVGFSQSATARALVERHVKESIDLQLDKVLLVALDERNEPKSHVNLKKDQTFTASGQVNITFQRLNPLSTLVTADVAEVDDPADATMGKLISALLELSETLSPGSTKRQDSQLTSSVFCNRVNAANAILKDLESSLYDAAWSADSIKSQLKAWTKAIENIHNDNKRGNVAIAEAIKLIESYLAKTATRESLDDLVKKAEGAVKKLNEVTLEETADPCTEQANILYRGMRLANPTARLAAVKTINASLVKLKESLQVYNVPARWIGPNGGNYIIYRGVEPSPQKMQVVTVKLLAIDYGKIDPVTPVVLASKEESLSASFTVRRYSFFVPELGGGLTYARIKQTAFGTGKNAAGEMIVTSADTGETSLTPAVMVNFVCRGCPLSVATPMFQVGVSASKEAPALFFGGGIRFAHVGKGDFAIGGGWALPWVKQLKSLKVGDVVQATTEVDKNLEFRLLRGSHPYLSLQYKF